MSSPSGRWGTPNALQNMQPGPQGQPWWYNSPGVQANPFNRSILTYGEGLTRGGRGPAPALPPMAPPPGETTGGDRGPMGGTPFTGFAPSAGNFTTGGQLSSQGYPNMAGASGAPVAHDPWGLPYMQPPSDGQTYYPAPDMDLDQWQQQMLLRNPDATRYRYGF